MAIGLWSRSRATVRPPAQSIESLRLEIFSAHHTRPLFKASHGIFRPIWGGGEPCPDGSYVTDVRIPRKTTLGYNETALHYYVWKHSIDHLDYVGFEHYRRMFLFPSLFDDRDDLSLPAVPEGWWFGYADEATYARMLEIRANSAPERIAALKRFVASHDIILPLPSATETLREQWIFCQYGLDTLDIMIKCIECTAAYRADPFPIDFDVKKAYFCNMFVMKTALFSSYMRLWEQVMFALQGHIDFTSRMPAYISERLFSIYFCQKIVTSDLRVAEIPFYFCQSRKVEEQRG